jgi:phosphopantothenoylcysteine synthetase/decarboxylase
MRPLLIVGGAPRVAVDAVRYLSVQATGATAVQLADLVRADGLAAELLLGIDASPAAAAQRFTDRAQLEAGLRRWIDGHREGMVVMSAAVNDYQVAEVELRKDGDVRHFAAGAKVPSGGDELVIRLRPAGKVIDQLRAWGLRGPIVGFKYEGRATVLASAEALRRRVGAELVVANSLCGAVQALVDVQGTTRHPDRGALLADLGRRIVRLAGAE